MYHKDIGSCEMYRHKTNARVQIPEGEKFMNERNVRPFSKRDEIGYVFGDMAGSFVNLFVLMCWESVRRGWVPCSLQRDSGMQ